MWISQLQLQVLWTEETAVRDSHWLPTVSSVCMNKRLNIMERLVMCVHLFAMWGAIQQTMNPLYWVACETFIAFTLVACHVRCNYKHDNQAIIWDYFNKHELPCELWFSNHCKLPRKIFSIKLVCHVHETWFNQNKAKSYVAQDDALCMEQLINSCRSAALKQAHLTVIHCTFKQSLTEISTTL